MGRGVTMLMQVIYISEKYTPFIAFTDILSTVLTLIVDKKQ